MPDQSLATTSKTYSPGSLNVADVVAVPLTPPEPASPFASSTAGFALAKVTIPGPRNLLQVTVTGGVLGRSIPVVPIRGIVASSETDTARVSGLARVAERAVPMGRGPWTELPPASLITGGVLPVVGSRKALISHSGLRLPGIIRGWPLLIRVQVSLSAPKSAGTVTVNRPHCRPGRKWVG